MIKNLAFLFFLCFAFFASAQIRQEQYPNLENRFLEDQEDSTYVNSKEIEVKLSDKTYYTDYKVISIHNDTTFIDTTLNLAKDYKFNYTAKDQFEYMAFANQGQTYNKLSYTFDDHSLYPKIGARAKHFNYFEVKDVSYYQVATPTTVLVYRKGIEQGQVMDGFFTFNTSPQLNASVAFKGLRSLGKYRHALSDHGNLRVTLSYHTKNKKYSIHSHLVAQDINNNENGGLTPESIENFESGDPNFTDRKRLITNFTDAVNTLRGNRYFITHNYSLWQKNDSLRFIPSELKIGHTFNYERKHYDYEQDAANLIFGRAFTSSIYDKLTYSKLFNEAYVSLNSPIVLGELKFKVNNFDYNYSYNSIIIKDDQIIDSNLNGNIISVGGEWQTKFKRINFNAEASTTVTGNLNGYLFSASASYVKDSLFSVRAGIHNHSKSPNFNFILNQSAYKEYNWQNDFKNEQINAIHFEVDAKKWIYASLELNNINNYTYFDAPDLNQQTKPAQEETVNYLKIKLSKEFKLGHFALENQFIYQNVMNGGDVFRVPDFVTRNTLYYANHLFKGKPLYLQTGITFSYFSKYYMNSYNPLISEFYLQNEREYGGFPLFDFFVNAQIRTMRIYIKLEHFNSSITGYNYYSAPTYPYRDFTFRLGLIWNFFI